MESEPTVGMILCALGGLAGAIFALPFKKVQDWAYESYWLVYAIFGLALFPIALAYATVPSFWTVLKSAPLSVLGRCFGFGVLWGVGSLTWGLMIRYLGIGLGLAIGCGLCSATGTLIPPIVTGRAADLVKGTPAIVTLCGVVGSLLGIIFVGLAGKSKEGELSGEEKKKAVAEFDFKKGIWAALFSGIASAGMNFGLQGGGALESAAMVHGTAENWKGIPVLVVVLLGGFVVNVLWCLTQNAKNQTFSDYRKNPGIVAGNLFFAGIAGVIWACQFVCQKMGEPKFGADIAYISFAVVIGASIFFSSLVGILLGEWKGVGTKTKALLGLGIIVLLASFCVMSYGNKLKGKLAALPTAPVEQTMPAA